MSEQRTAEFDSLLIVAWASPAREIRSCHSLPSNLPPQMKMTDRTEPRGELKMPGVNEWLLALLHFLGARI